MKRNIVEISDKKIENIEVLSDTVNEISDKIEEVVEKHTGEDTNGNGVLDNDELTEEQIVECEKSKTSQRDIRKMFYAVYTFTFLVLIAKFVSWYLFNVLIDIDISKLANTLNVAIVFIGSAEGIRSVTSTLGDSVGESTPLPAYKLKHLFGYLVAFMIIAISAIVFDFLVKASVERVSQEILPDFSVNDFTSGLLSNTIAYLIARYGSKVASGIDLSSLPFFKKKM